MWNGGDTICAVRKTEGTLESGQLAINGCVLGVLFEAMC
jgi:hypothetical protein